jgi:hypothetical protein
MSNTAERERLIALGLIRPFGLYTTPEPRRGTCLPLDEEGRLAAARTIELYTRLGPRAPEPTMTERTPPSAWREILNERHQKKFAKWRGEAA